MPSLEVMSLQVLGGGSRSLVGFSQFPISMDMERAEETLGSPLLNDGLLIP